MFGHRKNPPYIVRQRLYGSSIVRLLLCYWSHVTVQHHPARKVINRALILFKKSLTVNNFTGRGWY